MKIPLLLLCLELLLQPERRAALSDSATGFSQLQHMFGAQSTSNCSGAVDMKMLHSLSLSLDNMHSRISVPAGYVLKAHPDPVRLVNNGAGTTGTTTLFRHLCDRFNASGFHWDVRCGEAYKAFSPPLLAWTRRLVGCVAAHESDAICDRAAAVALYRDGLAEVASSGGSLFFDSPAAESFVDLIRLDPTVAVLSSYRSPSIWATKRRTEHPSTPVCHPRLWNAPGVLHPFDLIACIQAVDSKSFQSAITSVRRVPVAELTNAYIKMSTVNAFLTLATQRPFLPLCVFDMERHEPLEAVQAAFAELRAVTSDSFSPRPWNRIFDVKPLPELHQQ